MSKKMMNCKIDNNKTKNRIMDDAEQNTLTRGSFLRSASIMAAGFMLATREMFAQESPVITIKNEAAKSLVNVQVLRGNIPLREGSGGNIAVFNGPEGKLMVNAGIAVCQKKSLQPLQKLVLTL
jgi:hypothetical protein